MVKCPGCGNSGWFLKTRKCSICHKLGCDKCMTFLLDVLIGPAGERTRVLEAWYVCSAQCWEKFARKAEDKVAFNLVNMVRKLALQSYIEADPIEEDMDAQELRNRFNKMESVKLGDD